MLLHHKQAIQQLDARRGGYYYLVVPGAFVSALPQGKHTRLVCTIEGHVPFSCGLSHLGNGHCYVILSAKRLKEMSLRKAQVVSFSLDVDPLPLGVAVPEVLLALLETDDHLKHRFEALTDGKKRSIIHAMNRIKNIDKQVHHAVKMIQEGAVQRRRSL